MTELTPTTQTFTVITNTPIDFSKILSCTTYNFQHKIYKIISVSWGEIHQEWTEECTHISKTKKHFQNSMTLLVKVCANHIINVKLSQNGTMQMTGCKSINDAIGVLYCIYSQISKPKIESYIICYMTNIGFSLGFKLDREKLRSELLNQTEFDIICMNEPFYSYPGLVVKIPIFEDQIVNSKIVKLVFEECSDVPNILRIKYKDFLDTLPQKNVLKKIKTKHITFLIFSSGQIIVSSTIEELTTYYIDLLQKFIIKNKDKIQ